MEPVKIAPGTRLELNEHGKIAWGCPLCFVWNTVAGSEPGDRPPTDARCWNCLGHPKPDAQVPESDDELLAVQIAMAAPVNKSATPDSRWRAETPCGGESSRTIRR